MVKGRRDNCQKMSGLGLRLGLLEKKEKGEMGKDNVI